MTYNKSWQGRFVSGRFSALVLLGISLLMWLIGVLFDTPANDLDVFGYKIGNVMSRCITFVCFAFAAALMSSWYVFDRRIHWFLSLFFWLSSVSFFVHGSVAYSFSLLFFQLVLHRLFACRQEEDCRYVLFGAFSVFGLATMLFPQFLMLLPIFVCYLLMTALIGKKELWSILLGLLTPYWFLFGFDYIFPNVVQQSDFFIAPFVYMLSVMSVTLSLTDMLLLLPMLLVLLPFAFIFSNSSTPGKPLLRKRLRFFALQNLYLMILALLYSQDFILYYIWSLPSVAVMLTYIFSLNITRFSRLYFVFINIVWLALVPFCLWLKH